MLRLFVKRGDGVVLKGGTGNREGVDTRHIRGRQLQAAAKRLSPTHIIGSVKYKLP
jgi:hypothetical protein